MSLARMKLGAVIAGTLVLGCGLSSSPVIARVDGIRIAPGRVSLLPFQAAPLTVVVITSRGIDSSGGAGGAQWGKTRGETSPKRHLPRRPHNTHTTPPPPGPPLFP